MAADSAGRVMQLGAGELMRHTILALQRHGYEVYAIDRDPEAPGFTVADGHAPIDFADALAVTDYACTIEASLIIPVNDAGLMSATKASIALGLPGLSEDVAWRCLDKGEMRLAWRRAGLPQPDFHIVQNADEAHAAARDLGYPVVVKPTQGWGSRGVSRARDAHEMDIAYEAANDNCGLGKIIVETLLPGVLMTSDGLVRNGETSVLILGDVSQQAHERFLVNFALNYPAAFSATMTTLARQIIAGATMALGLRTGAFHCELMVIEDQVYLIELGARGGGGHLFGVIGEAGSGICAPAALAGLMLGEPVEIHPTRQHGVCYHFFTAPPGVIATIEGLEEGRSVPGIIDLGVQIRPGMSGGAVATDAARHGYCVAQGETREDAMAAAQAAIAKVRFVMEGPVRQDTADPPAEVSADE